MNRYLINKKVMCFLLSIVFFLVVVSFIEGANDSKVFALSEEQSLQKVYSNATLSDKFSSERVLVVMKEGADLKNAFNEIEYSSVDDISAVNIKKVANSKDSSVKDFRQVLSVELKDKGKQNVLDAIEELEQLDEVYYAGPDYVISVASTMPDDSYIEEQWAIDKIELPEVWDTLTSANTVIVGIMDTGIDGDHSDLTNRINVSLCRDFTSGEEVVTGTPDDPHGHGTHVAGIIGAEADNGIGVSGVCWDVQLVSLRVFDKRGYGYSSSVVKAINFANEQNIPILNLSGRWYSYASEYNVALDTAIKNYFGLFVCAAGNEGKNNDTVEVYPANIDSPNLISVAASDINDERWYELYEKSSNYGKTTVDLFAPGAGIYSTLPNNRYGTSSGTSMAAPYVAGVAALLLSYNPKLTAVELKESIMNSVDVIDVGWNNSTNLASVCVSGGRLNAYKALQYVQHEHSYTKKYVYVNNNRHNAYCSCGDFKWESHTVGGKTIIIGGQRYANCVFCNHSINLSSGSGQLITSIGSTTGESCDGIIYITSVEELEKYLATVKPELNQFPTNNSGQHFEKYEEVLACFNDEFFEKYSLITAV